jgi:hypothetical protein
MYSTEKLGTCTVVLPVVLVLVELACKSRSPDCPLLSHSHILCPHQGRLRTYPCRFLSWVDNTFAGVDHEMGPGNPFSGSKDDSGKRTYRKVGG